MTRKKIAYTEDAPGVFSFAFFPPTYCQATVARARRMKWNPAQVLEVSGVERIRSRTRSAKILNSPSAGEIYDRFDRRIERLVKPLIRQLWQFDLQEHSGTQMIRYGKGGHYVPHTDGGRDELAERYFSVVCYLNDDFDGGETSFPSLGAIVKPKTGRAIIFPSRYVHGAEPVTRGEKFVLITWLCGPVPIDWISD